MTQTTAGDESPQDPVRGFLPLAHPGAIRPPSREIATLGHFRSYRAAFAGYPRVVPLLTTTGVPVDHALTIIGPERAAGSGRAEEAFQRGLRQLVSGIAVEIAEAPGPSR